MFQFMQIEKSQSPHTKIGLGSDFRNGQDTRTPQMRFVGQVQQQLKAPNWTVPVIEHVRIHYDGPLTDPQVQATFGATIDPLGSNRNSPPPGATAVETTMAEPGKFQASVLITGIGWQCSPEPIVFVTKGNSFTLPVNATAAPVSPDVFTSQDDAIGALGPLGAATGAVKEAFLDWGNWQEQAFYHMANAYNLSWQMGNRTYLLNDSLRNTMYIPSNAQQGSASSSEQDVSYYIRLVNNYYRQLLGVTDIFLPIDRTRIGNFALTPTGGASTPGLSVFRPTRAYETVGATYGGAGLRAHLAGNQEVRRLTSPYLMKQGVPIGLKATIALNSSNDQAQMQAWLSASNGPILGGSLVPSNFTPDVNINATGVAAGGAIGMEPSLDATVVAEPMTLFLNRKNFKGGAWKLSVVVKGYELTDAQADYLKDPTVQSSLQSCGCTVGST